MRATPFSSLSFRKCAGWVLGCALGLVPGIAAAAESHLDLTDTPVGYVALVVFVLAYLIVVLEEFTELRKSKPMVLGAGIIWALIAWRYQAEGGAAFVEETARQTFLEYAELGLFLLVAMTYINSIDERRVFAALRSWLVSRRFTYRSMFWVTGTIAFFLSPVADNLTTALLMCAVVLAVGSGVRRFVQLAAINVVVAANAGGAFSPFGDITTLMVWQKGVIDFWTFFVLFLPSFVNFFVPAFIMSIYLPDGTPEAGGERVVMRRGAKTIMGLFVATIGTAVAFHHFLGLPPVLGMLTGLAYLQFYGFYLRKTAHRDGVKKDQDGNIVGDAVPFDVFNAITRIEWDTLLFFYGVVMCVGGLGFIGHLEAVSHLLYTQWGPLVANISVGLLSAVVDNIPVMFAVLTMNPAMAEGHWLLVTLTAGVGGSLLSIGSAAGVALMGQARGVYTFFSHLKWTPVIALGYAASIYVHMLLNGSHF